MFPNEFEDDDPSFTAIFYNSLPYPIDFYGYDFEGRKLQISKEIKRGHERTEQTSLMIPWVFVKSEDNSKRLFAFVKDTTGDIFKGKDFHANYNTTIHVIINDNGKFYYNS